KREPGLEDSARRLKEAADAMKQSAANSRSGAGAPGQSALDRLNEARRLLEKNRAGRLDRDLREAQQRAAELKAAQDKIASDGKDLRSGAADGQGRPGAERADLIGQRKDALEGELRDFQQQLERMARDSRQEQKNASRKIQEAASGIQDTKLKEKIRYSKGLLRGGSPEMAQQIESDISGNIGDLGKRLAEASSAMGGQSDDQKRAAALE